MGRRFMGVMARLEANLDKSGGPDACWPWMKGRTKKDEEYDRGYGLIGIIQSDGKLKTRTVHSVVYEIFVGPIPDGHRVCHKCDNPPCGNQKHLFTGTAKDNTRDMVAKGRARGGAINPPRGEDNKNATLTETQVIELLTFHMDAPDYSELAHQYNCSEGTIRFVLNGRVWGHVRPDIPRLKTRRTTYLTAAQIEEMRALYAQGTGRTIDDLADKYECGRVTVFNWCSGKYADVTPKR